MVSRQVILRTNFDRSWGDILSTLFREDFFILDLLIPWSLSPSPKPVIFEVFQCIYHTLADFLLQSVITQTI